MPTEAQVRLGIPAAGCEPTPSRTRSSPAAASPCIRAARSTVSPGTVRSVRLAAVVEPGCPIPGVADRALLEPFRPTINGSMLTLLALRPERRPKPEDRRKRLRRGRGVEQRQTACDCGASALRRTPDADDRRAKGALCAGCERLRGRPVRYCSGRAAIVSPGAPEVPAFAVAKRASGAGARTTVHRPIQEQARVRLRRVLGRALRSREGRGSRVGVVSESANPRVP